MLQHLPLVIFTLFQQVAIGSFFLIGILLVKNQLTLHENLAIGRRFIFIVVLIGIGLLASTFHLGTPIRGINAFNRLGQAWLSNEVFATGLFFAGGGAFWLLAKFKPEMKRLRSVCLIATILIGFFLILAMTFTYMIPTVPSWNNHYTMITFILTALIGGALTGHLLIFNTKLATPRVAAYLNYIGLTALFLSVMVAGLQTNYWSGISSSITNAVDQVPVFYDYLTTRLVLAIIAFMLWLWMIMKGSVCQMTVWVVLLLMLISEGLGRILFYAVYMTVGL